MVVCELTRDTQNGRNGFVQKTALQALNDELVREVRRSTLPVRTGCQDGKRSCPH